jgi:hypothetical protein
MADEQRPRADRRSVDRSTADRRAALDAVRDPGPEPTAHDRVRVDAAREHR